MKSGDRLTRAVVASVCAAIALALVLGAQVPPAPAQTVQMRTAEVMTHAARGPVRPVAGASARLVVSRSAASLHLFTVDLVPGNVHTVWWVFINKPKACAGSPCGPADVLQRTDTVESDVGYATGEIADASGTATFQAQLPAGPFRGGWFGRSLKDPMTAEIHVVLHDHGPVIPALRDNMLRTLRGGCTDASVPAAYPPVAKADGTPGPNRCQLYQFAVFLPPSL
ncbi:MAG: hypothetical protein ACRDF5_07880 [bacterium]